MIENYKVGDIIETKKPHPCDGKSKNWEILSLGGEVEIKCCGCGRTIFLSRWDFEKRAVRVVKTKEEIK